MTLFLIEFKKKLFMDKLATLEILNYVLESIFLIQKRFEVINSIEDFDTELGKEKLDAICMRLQTVGESIKILDKRERVFLNMVADDDYWSKIIKMREIISHHYATIDEEVVYMICSDHINKLEQHIHSLLQKL